MALIQKGIQEVSYKQKDGTVITKYRVRINKKELKLNKLVDSLEIANEIVNNSKTIIGKSALNEILFKENQENLEKYQRKLDLELFGLEALLEAFTQKHFIRKNNDLNELDRMSNRKYTRLVKTISNVEITNHSMFSGHSIISANVFGKQEGFLIKFGELDPLKMTSADIASYMEKRLETVGKATVKRELNYISSFF